MADKTCPLYKAPCVEHQCRWYIQIMGTMPQTGEQKAEWGCAVEWLPVLLIDNAKETRQAAAAVESSRNEAARTSAVLAGGLAAIVDTMNSAVPIGADQNPPRALPGHVIDERVERCSALYLEHKREPTKQ